MGLNSEKPPTPLECVRILDVVQAQWEDSPFLAQLILGGLGDRALPAALLCLEGSFTAAGEAMGIPKEQLLRGAQEAFLMVTGDAWTEKRKP